MSETTNSNIRSTGQSISPTTPIVSEVGSRSLGQMLRDARLDKSLDLRDIASQTRVRKQYLLALEEGQYEALPETVYTRNFIRLFATAVGLDGSTLLELYDHERAAFESKAAASSATSLASSQAQAPRTAAPQNLAVLKRQPAARKGGTGTGIDIGNVLPTLLLVVVILGLAFWAWDSGLLPGASVERVARTTPATTPAQQPLNSQDAGVLANPARSNNVSNNASVSTDLTDAQTDVSRIEPALPGTDTALATSTDADSASVALLSITTVPEGARVSIDNYEFPELSPIDNAPLSAGANRVLRVELEGYRVYEAPIDLSFNRNLEVYLTPLGEDDVTEGSAEVSSGELVDIDNPAASSEDDSTLADTDADDLSAEAAPAGPSTVSVEIVDAASWLEVYQGDDRGVGTTLLYRTAQPGETFEYEAPVYLFAGNAGNVLVSVDGGDSEAIGATGQVTGRAFTEESSVE
ncbi:MAG: RodZ domain-containing protein [Deinococcota bacterium]